MLHVLSTAINPTIRLDHVLRNWRRIHRGLAERPRKRTKQLDIICPTPLS